MGSRLGGKRGRLISSEIRQMAIESIATAVRHGARQQQACKIIDITVRTLQYWRVNGLEDQRQIVKKKPTNKLSEQEKNEVLPKALFTAFFELWAKYTIEGVQQSPVQSNDQLRIQQMAPINCGLGTLHV